MLDSFELDEVIFQEVPLYGSNRGRGWNDQPRQASYLGCAIRSPAISPSTTVPDDVLRNFAMYWPEGEIFHRVHTPSGPSMTPSVTDWAEADIQRRSIGNRLATVLENAQQLLVIPLWDVLHDRVVSIAIARANHWERVFKRSGDLFPMSSFCALVLQQARRVEARHMDQRKADFLGSVSHEMRSPLHGTLANIELLLETEVTDCLLYTSPSPRD